ARPTRSQAAPRDESARRSARTRIAPYDERSSASRSARLIVPPAWRLGAFWSTRRAPAAAKKAIAPHQSAAPKRKTERARRTGRSDLAHPLGRDEGGKEALLVAAAQEEPHGLAPALAVRARPVVHVHADEPVGLLA